jgi:hypothetical protein
MDYSDSTYDFNRYQASISLAADGRVVKKEININPTDTLYVKFKHNDYYAKALMTTTISK